MRTIEEIKAEIAAMGEYPKYVGQRDKLEAELYKAVTTGIDLDRLEEICNAEHERRLLILPAPIGGKVYLPYIFEETDGTVDLGVEESYLAGYVNEDGREFYLVYEADKGGCDIEPGMLLTSQEAAEAKLEEIKARKCRVCGCTWDHACPGGCYWVEPDLCSKCAELGEPIEVHMDHCQCGMAVDADDEVCPNCERPVVRR